MLYKLALPEGQVLTASVEADLACIFWWLVYNYSVADPCKAAASCNLALAMPISALPAAHRVKTKRAHWQKQCTVVNTIRCGKKCKMIKTAKCTEVVINTLTQRSKQSTLHNSSN